MLTSHYRPLTAEEVAKALTLSDGEDMNGEDKARDALSGTVEFTVEELEKLAAYRNVPVDYLTENDPAMRRYADPVIESRKAIAEKLLRTGMGAEFAAEKVRRLKKSV